MINSPIRSSIDPVAVLITLEVHGASYLAGFLARPSALDCSSAGSQRA